MAPLVRMLLASAFVSSEHHRNPPAFHDTKASTKIDGSILKIRGGASKLASSSSSSDDCYCLSKLCEGFGAGPKDLISLRTDSKGIRGVYLNGEVRENQIILSMPLDACLRDDAPPSWLAGAQSSSNTQTSFLEDAPNAVSVEGWVKPLTASLWETLQKKDEKSEAVREWLRLLPTDLREILPIHWIKNNKRNNNDSNALKHDDTIDRNKFLERSRSPSLELAVESALLARSDIVHGIVSSLKDRDDAATTEEEDLIDLQKSVEDALDLVQTRACRAESCGDSSIETYNNNDQQSSEIATRVLIPIFDMINHNREPNAVLFREGSSMVVRATRAIEANSEVFIDYGASTRPAWKCLFSYGFVPLSEDLYEDDAAEIVLLEDSDEEGGMVIEVGPTEIPMELIAHEANLLGQYQEEFGEVEFTPQIGQKIVDRLVASAKQLQEASSSSTTDCNSMSVADRSINDLLESNQRTLLACAGGLRDFLKESSTM